MINRHYQALGKSPGEKKYISKALSKEKAKSLLSPVTVYSVHLQDHVGSWTSSLAHCKTD